MPPSDEESDPLAAWLVNAAVDAFRPLEECGALYEQHAAVEAVEAVVSMASIAGEKERNEDAVAVWFPPTGSAVRWVAAVADGVSACFHPQLASRLACAAGLASVRADATGTHDASPVEAAQRVFDRLFTHVKDDMDGMRPAGTTNSMWKRVVRDGAYAQTTLVVLWQEGETLHVEGVGDGGMLVEVDGELLEHLPDANQSVHCLGPGRAGMQAGYRETFPNWSRVAVFTDGMTPWVRENVGAVFSQPADANSLVGRALVETDVRDNVSLFLAGQGTT